ncbi:MAG: HIT family protein [Pseudonocardiaceae bacterium]
MNSCVFCRVAAGTAPAHVIWADADHMAFLSIFPNTPGCTVVIPRAHASSDVTSLPPADFLALHEAAGHVARLLTAAFDDVARTGIIYEGYGIDHAHAKLFPMHGTAGNQGAAWTAVSSDIDTFFPVYRGYLSSHDSHRADNADLAALAARIRSHLPACAV